MIVQLRFVESVLLVLLSYFTYCVAIGNTTNSSTYVNGNETNTTNIDPTSLIGDVIEEGSNMIKNLSGAVIGVGGAIVAGIAIRKWWYGKKEKKLTASSYEFVPLTSLQLF